MNLRTLKYYNDILAAIFGYILTLVLIFLIKTKSTKELKPYSNILFLNCFLDLLYNTNTLFFGMKVDVKDGVILIINDSLIPLCQNSWLHICNATFVYIYVFCLISMAIPFFFRYMMFCRSITLSGYIIFLLYALMGILASVFTSFYLLAFYTDDISMLNHSYLIGNFWKNEDGTIPQFDFAQLANIFLISALGFAMIMFAINFLIILWLSRNIWAKFHDTKNLMSAKTQAMQKQLTIVLIAQAACPICVALIPCLFLIAMILLRINMPGIVTPCLMSVAWNAVLNPLCTILFVAPFRKAVKQCLQWTILRARVSRVFVLPSS